MASPHATTGGRDAKYSIEGRIFREHLQLLAHERFRVTLLDELWRPMTTRADSRDRVVLTFDDGRASDYEIAFPALQKAGVKAEFFLNTASIGQPGFLTWPRLIEMHRAGLSIQSHGHDHVVLLGLPAPALDRQLRHSKHLLEDRLGAPVTFFAAPYGFLNRRVVQTALDIGYRAVCTSYAWLARPGAPTVSRVVMYRDTTSTEILQLLRGNPLSLLRRAVRNALTHIPKLVLLHLRPARLGVRLLEMRA